MDKNFSKFMNKVVGLRKNGGVLSIGDLRFTSDKHKPDLPEDNLEFVVPVPWRARLEPGGMRPYFNKDRYLVEMELALLLLKHPELQAEKSSFVNMRDDISKMTCEWVVGHRGNTGGENELIKAWVRMLSTHYDFVSGDGLVLENEVAFAEIGMSVSIALEHYGSINSEYGYLTPDVVMEGLLEEIEELSKTDLEGVGPADFDQLSDRVTYLLNHDFHSLKNQFDSALRDQVVAKECMEKFDAAMAKERPPPSWYMEHKRRLASDLAKADLRVAECRESLIKNGWWKSLPKILPNEWLDSET